MSPQQSTDATLQVLMKQLESKDGLLRQKARISLVVLGESAVLPLSDTLQHSRNAPARWGAAKALGEIVDERSIPALVSALDDKNADVAWLAGLALKKFKKAAWMHLLQKLIESGVDSVRLRNGTRHVFSTQKEEGFNDLLEELMIALEDAALPEAGPLVATEIVRRMRIYKNNVQDVHEVSATAASEDASL